MYWQRKNVLVSCQNIGKLIETSKFTSNMEAKIWGFASYILVGYKTTLLSDKSDRTSKDQLHSKIQQTDGEFYSQQK